MQPILIHHSELVAQRLIEIFGDLSPLMLLTPARNNEIFLFARRERTSYGLAKLRQTPEHCRGRISWKLNDDRY